MKFARLIVPVCLAAFFCTILLSACDSPPEEELAAAEDVLKQARDAGAEEYSPKLYDKARDLLREAKMLNDQGQYKEAKKKAEYAELRANQALKNAKNMANAEEAREQFE